MKMTGSRLPREAAGCSPFPFTPPETLENRHFTPPPDSHFVSWHSKASRFVRGNACAIWTQSPPPTPPPPLGLWGRGREGRGQTPGAGAGCFSLQAATDASAWRRQTGMAATTRGERAVVYTLLPMCLSMVTWPPACTRAGKVCACVRWGMWTDAEIFTQVSCYTSHFLLRTAFYSSAPHPPRWIWHVIVHLKPQSWFSRRENKLETLKLWPRNTANVLSFWHTSQSHRATAPFSLGRVSDSLSQICTLSQSTEHNRVW